jgi:mannosyl-oligosaccharide alpha-1,2-mannosidase
VTFKSNADFFSTKSNGLFYLLRPEAIESLFVMWRITHDVRYRQMAWRIFTSIEKHCKVASGGYSGVKDVRQAHLVHDDLQQTFLLAETFKYLYLIFSDDDVISLDEYIFNTEAHPLKILSKEVLDNSPIIKKLMEP